jgi:hypothetical protein
LDVIRVMQDQIKVLQQQVADLLSQPKKKK